MNWLLLTVAAVILGIWLYNIYQRHIRSQRQQLKIAGVTRVIIPLTIKVYNQLIEEIRDRWPYITFEFPTINDLIANSTSLLLA